MESQNAPKGEHYNLRWTNYLTNLSQVVFEHHLNESLVDVTLVCEGQYIKAHKLVLSACSNFFQDMFRLNTNVAQLPGSIIHPFIVMNGIRFVHLKHIIDFMYQGEIKVLDTDLEGVLALGESLQVKGLCSVKLKQKIGLNNEVKAAEQSVSPAPQPTITRPEIKQQPIPIEPKTNLDNTNNAVFPRKNYPKTISRMPSASCAANLDENLCVNRSQEEPKNYSKVTLDALAANHSASQKNHVKKEKTEEKYLKISTMINQPIHIEDDSQEPIGKKMKFHPPPLIIRRSDMIKVKPSTELMQARKSPVISKEEKQDKMILPSQPVIVDAEKTNKDVLNEIPKPPNAFMIFATEWRKKLAVEHPEENNKDISIRLGNLWKTLSPETKETYYQAAQSALREHELKYPQVTIKTEPFKKKKIIIKRFEDVGTSEPVDLKDDDLEIIETPEPTDSSTKNSTSTPLT